MPDAVLYARVSTDRQATQGYSQGEQVSRARAYASRQGLTIVAEFVEADSASRMGRKAFAAMLAHLRTMPPGERRVIVEDVSRLSRNKKDFVALEELRPELHLLRDGRIVTPDANPTESLHTDIDLSIAAYFSKVQGAKARDGMAAKAARGEFPTLAPFGYRNATGPTGHSNLVVDPAMAPVVQWLFETYAAGEHSLRSLAAAAFQAGYVHPGTQRPFGISHVHNILRREAYVGVFTWKGIVYQGTYEPLVSPAVFYQVQELLATRDQGRRRSGRPRLGAFTGFLTCRHCGCALTFYRIKKPRGVEHRYYHCTSQRGNCGEPYLREADLAEACAVALEQLIFDDAALAAIRQQLQFGHQAHQLERKDRLGSITRQERLHQRRLDQLLTHLVDERITAAEFDRLAHAERAALALCLEERTALGADDRGYFLEVVQLLELLQAAPRRFRKQVPEEQRALLDDFTRGGSWGAGTLQLEWRPPFDRCAREAAALRDAPAACSRIDVWGA